MDAVKRVLAVGDVNLDLLLTGLDRLPAAEEESLARGLEFLVGGQTGTGGPARAPAAMPQEPKPTTSSVTALMTCPFSGPSSACRR